jgi:hypothetical protein
VAVVAAVGAPGNDVMIFKIFPSKNGQFLLNKALHVKC